MKRRDVGRRRGAKGLVRVESSLEDVVDAEPLERAGAVARRDDASRRPDHDAVHGDVPSALGAAPRAEVPDARGDALRGRVLEDRLVALRRAARVRWHDGRPDERGHVAARRQLPQDRLEDLIARAALGQPREEAQELADLRVLEDDGAGEPALGHAPPDVRVVFLALEREPVGLELFEALA